MTSYKVLSDGTITSGEVFNPAPGQILATFPVPQVVTPFNPLTFLTDGRIQEIQRLNAEAKSAAEKWAKDNGVIA